MNILEKIGYEARLFKAWLGSALGLSTAEALENAGEQVAHLQAAQLGGPLADLAVTLLEGVIGSPASHPIIGDVPVFNPRDAHMVAMSVLAAKPDWAAGLQQVATTAAGIAAALTPTPAPIPDPVPPPAPAPVPPEDKQ